MKRLALAFMLASMACFAQQRNTVYQQLFDGPITTAPETSDYFNPIGQTQHKVTLVLSDGGGTCVGGFVDIFLEGSGTGAAGTYNVVGNPISNISVNQYGQYVAVAEADIALPYVRLVVNSFDTVNCQLTALYSGTIAPTAPNVPTLLYPLQTVSDGVPIIRQPSTNVANSQAFNSHKVFIDVSDCTGGDVYSFETQLQYSFDDDGPWTPVGYTGNFVSTLPERRRDPVGVGKFPLIRIWLLSASTTGCDATIYYWGSNDVINGNDVVTSTMQLSSASVLASGTSTLVAPQTGTYVEVNGLVLDNPCADGFIRVQLDTGIIASTNTLRANAGQVVVLPINQKYMRTDVDEGWDLIGSPTLTASCLASARLWYSRVSPVYP